MDEGSIQGSTEHERHMSRPPGVQCWGRVLAAWCSESGGLFVGETEPPLLIHLGVIQQCAWNRWAQTLRTEQSNPTLDGEETASN